MMSCHSAGIGALRTKREMKYNEDRLTVIIEDPRDVERRRLLNIEDERGCSREEIGNALAEVYEGRIPQDRITLRELAKEMLNWPNLEDEINAQEHLPRVASPYAKVTDTRVDPRLAAERAKVDWDSSAEILPGEEKKDISEVLPPAMANTVPLMCTGERRALTSFFIGLVHGFSFLYLKTWGASLMTAAAVHNSNQTRIPVNTNLGHNTGTTRNFQEIWLRT